MEYLVVLFFNNDGKACIKTYFRKCLVMLLLLGMFLQYYNKIIQKDQTVEVYFASDILNS
jgi:uncharacterized membrane protein